MVVEVHKVRVVFLERLLEVVEGLVRLTQTQVDCREVKQGYVFAVRALQQLGEYLSRPGLVTLQPVGPTER